MKKMKKLCSISLVVMLMMSLTMLNASAEEVEAPEPEEITTTDTEEVEAELDTVTPVVAILDNMALQTVLDAGIKQGKILDISPYYTGDMEDLDITITNGDALVKGSEILFTTAGTIDFTVEDGVMAPGLFSVTVVANPITGLAFDKTEATIAIGKSVDLLISLVPEDGYLPDALSIVATYEGKGRVKIEGIVDENNPDYIIGYRVSGVAAGVVTIRLEDADGTLTPAIATITVQGGSITGVSTDPTITPTSTINSKKVPATGDSTTMSAYVTLLFTSVAMAGYVVLAKKRNLLNK